MKLYSMILLLLVVFITSCDENIAPNEDAVNQSISKEKFVFNSPTDSASTSLKNAKIYLVVTALVDWEPFTNQRYFRYYMITDGVYNNEGGSYTENYIGASYTFMVILVSSDQGEAIEPGTYVQNIYDVLLEKQTIIQKLPTTQSQYDTFEESTNFTSIESEWLDHSPLIVNGGTEIGQTMNIKFNGLLARFKYVNGVYYESDIQIAESSIHVKAKVLDATYSTSAGRISNQNTNNLLLERVFKINSK